MNTERENNEYLRSSRDPDFSNISADILPHILFFVIFFTLWCTLPSYGFTAAQEVRYSSFDSNIMNEICIFIRKSGFFSLIFCLVAAISWKSYFEAVYFWLKYVIPIWITIILVILLITLITEDHILPFYLILGSLLTFAACRAILFMFKVADADVIQELIKSITYLQVYTFFTAIIQCMLLAPVLLFILRILRFLFAEIDVTGNIFEKVHLVFLIAFSIYGSLWILLIIYNFGQIIHHEMFTSYHFAKVKVRFEDYVRRNFWGFYLSMLQRVIRYHLTTLISGSAMFFPLKFFYICRKDLWTSFKRGPIVILLFMFVLMTNSSNIFIACSSYRCNDYYRSRRITIKLLLQNHKKFTNTHVVCGMMMLLGITSIFIFTLFLGLLLFCGFNKIFPEIITRRDFEAAIPVGLCFIIYLFISFHTSVNAFLFRHLHNVNSLKTQDNVEEHILIPI